MTKRNEVEKSVRRRMSRLTYCRRDELADGKERKCIMNKNIKKLAVVALAGLTLC